MFEDGQGMSRHGSRGQEVTSAMCHCMPLGTFPILLVFKLESCRSARAVAYLLDNRGHMQPHPHQSLRCLSSYGPQGTRCQQQGEV